MRMLRVSTRIVGKGLWIHIKILLVMNGLVFRKISALNGQKAGFLEQKCKREFKWPLRYGDEGEGYLAKKQQEFLGCFFFFSQVISIGQVHKILIQF